MFAKSVDFFTEICDNKQGMKYREKKKIGGMKS
jgi:hypothetical protein